MTTAYNHLCTAFTRLSRFEHLSAIAGWDMQTMMPRKEILLAQKPWPSLMYCSIRF